MIGAYKHDKKDTDSGSAYVFKRSETTWAQQQKLMASDGEVGDRFSYTVSISGDYTIIGANGDDDGGIDDSGAAYVFKRSGTTWTEQQKLKASDPQSDVFGSSVSISGGYSVIGAHGDDDGATADAGAAYVFAMN